MPKKDSVVGSINLDHSFQDSDYNRLESIFQTYGKKIVNIE